MTLKILIFTIISLSSFAQNNWIYDEKEDRMIDKKIFYAYCESVPENGGKSYTLIIKYAPIKSTDPSYGSIYEYDNSVYLNCNGCVFDSSIFESNSLDIRFDTNEPMKWGYSGAKGSYEAVFLSNEKRLIKRLKNSKRVLVKIFIYGQGYKVIEFNVEGLKWNDL